MIRSFTYWGSPLGSMRVPSHDELKAVMPFGLCRWDSEFLDSYLLVCPHCGEVWLRSECEGHSLPHKWSIRERYCFEHANEHFAAVQPFVDHKLANSLTPFLSPPGAILSFYSNFHAVGQEQWLLWYKELPAAAKRFELKAWTALDLRINPLEGITFHVTPADEQPAASSNEPPAEWYDGAGVTEPWEYKPPESPRHEGNQLRPDGSGEDLQLINYPEGV